MQLSPKDYETFDSPLTNRERKKVIRRAKKGAQTFNVINNGISVLPKNTKQQELIDAINNKSQIFVLGPAGTGKTFICASLAAKYYFERKIDKIIITRPNVSSSRSLGLFPGSIEEKMAPWLSPITNVLQQHLGDDIYNIALKRGSIKIEPFETMRGASFENAIVILDEAQNVPFDEMKMFLTRIGENSKVILNGDIKQSDLKKDSGYMKTIQLMAKYNMDDAAVIEFSIDDCVRSGICKQWLEVFDKEGI